MSKFTPAVLCALLVACTLAAPLEEQMSEYRLVGSIIPSHYDLSLQTYITPSETTPDFKFTGKVVITFTATKIQKEIVLHSKDLTIKKEDVTLQIKDGKVPLDIEDVGAADPKTDLVKIKLKADLEKDSKIYELTIVYSGTLGENMQGFYRSYYMEGSKKIWLASTHFQTHHARRAFPCFDEPKYKANFKIEINHHKDLTAVSNTKVDGTPAIVGDRKITKFEQTPKMSTYLVAFLVSNFRPRKAGDFSVLARPAAYAQTEYSFDVGQKLLKEMDKYFDLPYKELGNPKMDLAAIPDFSAGAMENWGLITYRERALLYDPKTTTANYQQSVAATIAHEQAHMWFGDYVTCDWWDNTWLNEGFARYFQYYILSKVEPKWEMEEQFAVDQIQSVFNMDSLPGTHALTSTNINSPSELRQMFSSISYNKGAAVIRMTKYMLEEANFQKALRSYLKAYATQTTKPENLFEEFRKVWDNKEVDLVQILKDFTTQVGYPVLYVRLQPDGKGLTVSQKRFLLKKPATKDESNILYTIPFTFTTDELDFAKTKPTEFLPKSSNDVVIPLSKKTEYVIANIQQTGYYRVNYDEPIWHKIHNVLEKDLNTIDVRNRAQIVDDLFNLARAEIIDYKLALDILEYLRQETHYLPWVAAFNGYSSLATRIGQNHVDLFGKHIRRLTENVYKKLGFEAEGDGRLDVYNRVKVLHWACKYKNEDCITKSKEIFKGFMDKDEQVSVNIRQPVYCSAIREGGKEEFDFLWKKYESANVASEQVLILNTLGCAKIKEVVEPYLTHIVSDKVRLQDKSTALTALYTENLESVDMVFEYVLTNYQKIKESFGDMSDVASILSGISGRFTSAGQIEKLRKFLTEKRDEFGESADTLDKAITSAEENLKWSEKIVPHFMGLVKIKNSSAIVQSSLIVTITLALLAIAWSQ